MHLCMISFFLSIDWWCCCFFVIGPLLCCVPRRLLSPFKLYYLWCKTMVYSSYHRGWYDGVNYTSPISNHGCAQHPFGASFDWPLRFSIYLPISQHKAPRPRNDPGTSCTSCRIFKYSYRHAGSKSYFMDGAHM
jgi:hypothetical protein